MRQGGGQPSTACQGLLTALLSCLCLCCLGLSSRRHQTAPSCCPAEADAALWLLPCQIKSVQNHLGCALAQDPAGVGAQPSPHVGNHLINWGSTSWVCPGLPQRQLAQATQLLVRQIPVCPARSIGACLSRSWGQAGNTGRGSISSPSPLLLRPTAVETRLQAVRLMQDKASPVAQTCRSHFSRQLTA